MVRTLQCLLRNPMDVGFKLIQSVFTAIIVVIVYGHVRCFLMLRSITISSRMSRVSYFSWFQVMLSQVCRALWLRCPDKGQFFWGKDTVKYTQRYRTFWQEQRRISHLNLCTQPQELLWFTSSQDSEIRHLSNFYAWQSQSTAYIFVVRPMDCFTRQSFPSLKQPWLWFRFWSFPSCFCQVSSSTWTTMSISEWSSTQSCTCHRSNMDTSQEWRPLTTFKRNTRQKDLKKIFWLWSGLGWH